MPNSNGEWCSRKRETNNVTDLLQDTRIRPKEAQWAFVSMPFVDTTGAGATQRLLEALSEHLGTGANALQWLTYCSHLPSTRTWSLFDTSKRAPILENRRTSQLVDTIRKAFRLTVTDLAAVLRVQRPTVYAWLKDDAELKAENEWRLHQVAELADEWLILVPRGGGPDALEGPGLSRDMITLLSLPDLDTEGSRAALADEARTVQSVSRRSRFRDDLSTRAPRRSESEFDLETRRPLGPQLAE
jgi:transcriptional regulator with XRE-family HTH domain